ncbi:MAG: hypothetical protein AMXMBFR53_39370 [Gemmatimonadota bacterium]
MSPELPRNPDRRRLFGILVYYGLLAGAVYALVRGVPAVGEALAGGGLSRLADVSLPDAAAPVGAPVAQTPWSGGALGIISMVAALAIMVPVTWIYMVTRRHRGYHESVVHTLLVLPVAVTGIVMIVQHSLALAFSLAGIVAAVRFRTTLEDTKDAVYVFLAIGVGLACGVQAMGLAFVLSLVFNAVILALWATRFGNPYAVASSGTGHIALGDALAGPPSAATRTVVGDVSLLDAAAPADVGEALAQAARLERHLAEERLKKKARRANALLLVHATAVEACQAAVEPILEESTSRWKLAEVVQTPEGRWVLEYLLRVDAPASTGALLDRIHASGDAVAAAEMRSLKGLKGRA